MTLAKFRLCADNDGAMIRERDAHFTLCERNIRGRPTEDPFCILRRDIDTAMGTFLTKGVMPESTMDRNSIPTDHGVPRDSGRGIS